MYIKETKKSNGSGHSKHSSQELNGSPCFKELEVRLDTTVSWLDVIMGIVPKSIMSQASSNLLRSKFH